MSYYLVEGYGGCGKTTLINFLIRAMRDSNKTVSLTREPGGATELGDKIRNILLYEDCMKEAPVAQMFLFLADRALHMEQFVRPWINTGKDLVQDRGFISTLVYQGVEFGLGSDYVHELHQKNGLYEPYPDKVILIDVDAEICMQRLNQRDGDNKHNFNRCNLDKLKKRREIYLECAKKYVPNDKLLIIDNNLPLVQVCDILLEKLEIR